MEEPLEESGLGLGFSAFEGHDGAFRLLKRFVIPSQSFWGRFSHYDAEKGTLKVPVMGGFWEVDLEEAPVRFGLSQKPDDVLDEANGSAEGGIRGASAVIDLVSNDKERETPKREWEWVTKMDIGLHNSSQNGYLGSDVSPDGRNYVCCGENGLIVAYCRKDELATEEVEAIEVD